MANAPSRMAIGALPGMPKATVGIRAAPFMALLAVSGAMTPRTSPLPNIDLSFDDWTACPYATQSTMAPPSPGSIPT